MTQLFDLNSEHIGSLRRPIGIVCHDAGGADQLVSHLQYCLNPKDKNDEVLVYTSGPAAKIFQSRKLPLTSVASLENLVASASTIVSGTGWSSDVEHNARRLAADQHRYSISILDNWTNYGDRFERHGLVQLPDEIWVVDTIAREIAKAEFPNTTVRQIPDLRTAQFLTLIASAQQVLEPEILYVAEPVRPLGVSDPNLERIAFRYFLDRLGALSGPPLQVIRLRIHPAQDPRVFEPLMRSSTKQIIIDQLDAHESVARASLVVGMNSSLLAMAQLAGRRVVTAIPPGFPERTLPHEGIGVL